jgi:hypothetical protein
MTTRCAWPTAPDHAAAFEDEPPQKPSILDEVFVGRRRWDDPEITALATARDLDRAVRDPIAVEEVVRAPTLAELVRVATDASPALGNEAPDRLFGSRAVDLAAADPAGRHWLSTAAAAACFFLDDADGREAWEFWASNEPPPTREERARVRAVARAPWVAWHVDEVWTPCFDVDRRWVPDRAPAVIGPRAPIAGEIWCARVIRTTEGPVASLAVPVRGLDWEPAVKTLVRWARIRDSRYTREGVLRRFGHTLVRLAGPLPTPVGHRGQP